MAHFLIVGIDGVIGAALFSQLQSVNEVVLGSTYHEEKVKHAHHLFHLNLADPHLLQSLPKIKVKVVYLCAGIANMSLCEEHPELTKKINVIGMKKLIRYFSDAGSFVVFLSSNQIFSGQEPFVNEDMAYQPNSEYGRQKAEVESYIKTTCRRYAIVRLTKVIGPNMRLLKDWLNKLIVNQSVEAYHDMVFAPLTLDYVIEMLLAIGYKEQTACYQLSGPEDVSYYQLAHYMAESVMRATSLIYPVSAAERGVDIKYRPRHTTLDCSRIMSLGWKQPPHYSVIMNEAMKIGHCI